MEVDVKCVELKRSDSFGFGFSVCGGSGSGLPPVIYDVVENSPAANCGELESGDVILEINSREVVSLTTKEVLKCLRLSNDLVTLKVKRDPSIKERVRRHLTGSIEMEAVWRSAPPNNECHSRSNEGAFKTISTTETNGDSSSNDENRPPTPVEAALPPQNDISPDPAEGLKSRSKPSQPRFETFMMTGDLIINLNAKSSNASSVQLPKSKKIDNLPFGQCSTPASPEESEYRCRGKGTKREATAFHSPVAEKKGSFNYTGGFVRTSKSEDHLQKASLTTVNIDIEDDMASSLNTLLDDRDNPANDRIVWTYNAPVSSDGRVPSSPPHTPTSPRSLSSSSSNGKTASPSKGSSPKRRAPAAHNQSEGSIQNSDGTTCSASVRTFENGQPDDQSKTDFGSDLGSCISSTEEATQPPGTDSDLSSPMENLSPGDESLPNVDWSLELECRDPVINDKLVSKVPPQSNGVVNGVEGPNNRLSRTDGVTNIIVDANKVCVQVYPDKLKTSESFSTFRTGDQAECTDATSPLSIESESTLGEVSYQELRESQDEDLPTPVQEDKMLPIHDETRRHSTSPTTDDESDSESLHSYHYSPKAVDMPSASRLAKRLYNLEGFKKSDVSRHLSKNNEFSRVVAEEYLKFFDFTDDTLDIALRKFLKQFCLIGETQERERVLVHFSKRYLDCNPGCFKSQDAVHTLTCAIMLLNTDLHGENVGRKMTCAEFIENLSELNDGENFPKEVLKALYQAIKTTPLEWAVDEDDEQMTTESHTVGPETRQSFIGHNPFLEVPNPHCATEYKKGYVMRKCCVDPNGKRTPLGKRGWKMFYATLRDLVLYLHKDEHGFRKNQLYDSLHNSIRIHHALTTKATDYTKKQHVFRLQTADQAEYLFQTSDSKELQSWIDTINFVAASLSAPPLASAVGSQKKFQRPLLPVSHTKLNLREQLQDHENRIMRLERELEEHLAHAPERGARSRLIHDFVEKEAYLQYELRRYRTYAFLLRSKMAQYPELEPPLVETSIGEVDEPVEKNDQTETQQPVHIIDRSSVKRSMSDRYSYRAAIYRNNFSDECG